MIMRLLLHDGLDKNPDPALLYLSVETVTLRLVIFGSVIFLDSERDSTSLKLPLFSFKQFYTSD
jgi:hypothetical protein